jgi:hypothetical protein
MASLFRTVAFLCLLGGLAQAGPAKIGQTTIALTLPAGYCEIDATKNPDKRLYDTVRAVLPASNTLLLMMGDCAELDAWHTGKRKTLDSQAQYQTLTRMMGDETVPTELIKQTCEALRAQGDKILADQIPDIQARAERELKQIKVGEGRFLGVVGEEPLACYAAILQKLTAEDKTEKTIVVLYATTVIKGKLLYYYLFAPFTGEGTMPGLLTKHKDNVAKLLAAN